LILLIALILSACQNLPTSIIPPTPAGPTGATPTSPPAPSRQPATAAASGRTIDLGARNAVDVVLYGQEAQDFFGTDLATGDLNGDGIADLAVGAYLADGPANSRSGAGEVYVFYGQPADDWPALGRPPDITVYGAEAGDTLGGDWTKEPGHIVIGDVDQDGVGDLVLSAPPFKNEGLSRGRVYILWGRADLPGEIDLKAVPPALEVTTVAAVDRDFLGSALATGDFDGDGIDDVAMAAPLAETEEARLSAGIVYVLFGGTHLRGRSLAPGAVPEDVSIFTAVGEARNKTLGSYLAFGALSDDSQPAPRQSLVPIPRQNSGQGSAEGSGQDLAIGSTSGGEEQEGTVEVVFGRPQVRGLTWDFLTDPPDWSAVGEKRNDQFGLFLVTGDINADTQADLLVGAPSADGPAGPGTGQGLGVFGPLAAGQRQDLATTPADLTIYGPQAGFAGADQAWLGGSVAMGDFNTDGVGDLLVGARQANGFNTRARAESGIAYVFYGGPSLKGTVDLRRASADITFMGARARDFTGYVTAGDVTGDGIDDLIISATDRTSPDAGSKAGAVYIVFGAP
jgi:hypothetical protein